MMIDDGGGGDVNVVDDHNDIDVVTSMTVQETVTIIFYLFWR